MLRVLTPALMVAFLFAAISATLAADGSAITVNANMARVLRINAPAATVIVGNPAVADVTIQDPQTLILTGKSYGRTNLIVLDAIGNPIADTLIDVVQQQAGTLTVYQGLKRQSLSCSPICQPSIVLGDDSEFLSNSVSNSSLVGGAAN